MHPQENDPQDQDPQDQPPQDPPSRAVRRLALESMDVQQAAYSVPPRSPSRERCANIVDEEAPFPASPVIYCSQYRMEEYERENGPLPGNEKVGEWLHTVETAYLPAASSQGNGLKPTLPAAPPKDQYVTDSESPSASRSQPPVRYPTPPAAPPKDDYIPESDSECSNNYGQPRHWAGSAAGARLLPTFFGTGNLCSTRCTKAGSHSPSSTLACTKADVTSGMGSTTSVIWCGRIDSTGS